MTLPWRNTQRKAFRGWSVSSPIPVRSSGWPSASRKLRSWARTLLVPHPSPLTTRCFRSPTTSPTWAPPSPATCRLTWRSSGASRKRLPSWPSWARECGPTVSWLWTPNWRFTRPVSSVPCYTAASPCQRTQDRKTAWRAFTSDAWAVSSASPGRTRSLTLL